MKFFICKWAVSFLLTGLLFPYSTNARLSEPDWSELDRQIQEGKWCNRKRNYCRQRTTNSSVQKQNRNYYVDAGGPNSMNENESVLPLMRKYRNTFYHREREAPSFSMVLRNCKY